MKPGIVKGENKLYMNLLIGGAVVVAAVAGYFMLTAKSTTDTTKGTAGQSKSSGNSTSIDTSKQCKTTAAEFPMRLGSGYSGNANEHCETVYVRVIQTVMNKYLKQDGMELLTVDGKFGAKTATAVSYVYNGLTDNITKQDYDDLVTYNKNNI